MLQIVNITDARNNLAKLIEKIKDDNKPVIIVQDSTPSVVIYPYEDLVKREKDNEELFQLRFQEVIKAGKKAFSQYLSKNKLNPPQNEEEAYDIIKNG